MTPHSRIMRFVGLAAMTLSSASFAGEYLVRFSQGAPADRAAFLTSNGGQLDLVSAPGLLYKWTSPDGRSPVTPRSAGVAFVEPNRIISIPENPSLAAARQAALRAGLRLNNAPAPETDNPAIQSPPVQASGSDPLLPNAWGMAMTDAIGAWKKAPLGRSIVVAVTDTGVDYNHQDLIANIWRNKSEIEGNGIDDDGNGYVDDIAGWDFYSNDNKPFDLSMSLVEILFQGGNPGHGTHVAGVVGARLNNSLGTAGVAPECRIMALRFISEKGQGTTDGAIKAIDYAVSNGAHVINASWGGEAGDEDDSALREAIRRAEARGVIFVAAAGNGRLNQTTGKSQGFDNDADAKPMVPASFAIPNIVAVAAIDSDQGLAQFSNWGKTSVKLGAPGVKILSTVPGNKYQDTIIDMGGIKATWDGTSMAAPFVSGALALLWSQNVAQTGPQVRDRVLAFVQSAAALEGKVASGGRLDLRRLQ